MMRVRTRERRCAMKRTLWIGGGLVFLAGGAYTAGRLLSRGFYEDRSNSGATVQVATGNGQVITAEWVPAAELPAEAPDVAGAFARREDNRFFVNETEGGFVLSKGEDGSLSVTNITGKVSEVVVTGETLVRVDTTLEKLDTACVDGRCYQQLTPGSVEEIGELSFVRAWGEMRGDRLIARVLLYSRPPVISR
jgi:hypothetical protein